MSGNEIVMTVKGIGITSAQREAAMRAMEGTFTASHIAAALARAGLFWNRHNPDVADRTADRLLQGARKAGLIRFAKGKWERIA